MAYIVTYDLYMSAGEMQAICPSAEQIMKCLIKGYRLTFRRCFFSGVLSIESGTDKDAVPAVVWEISEEDEKDLAQIYLRELYEKAVFNLQGKDFEVEVFAYVLKETEIMLPDEDYMEKVNRAYEEQNFDYWYIENVSDFTADYLKKEGKAYGSLHTGADRTGEQHRS